jgi:hypothetical protein
MSDAYFCVVWAEKNAERKAQGAEELNFREARKEFGFDAPPPGAVTLYSGGDGIRAFPGKTPDGRDTWYAQYRQVSAKGVLWRMINEANKQPICYIGATEALDAAKLASGSRGVAGQPHQEIEYAGRIE